MTNISFYGTKNWGLSFKVNELIVDRKDENERKLQYLILNHDLKI